MNQFIFGEDGLPHITKDPDAKLTYVWNWVLWLSSGGGASIVSATITPDAGLVTEGSTIIASPRVRQTFSGGAIGQSYKAICHVVSNTGEEDDQTIVIDIAER